MPLDAIKPSEQGLDRVFEFNGTTEDGKNFCAVLDAGGHWKVQPCSE